MIVIINDLQETKFYIVAKDELQQFIKNKNTALSEEIQYRGNYETNTKEEIQKKKYRMFLLMVEWLL